MTLTVSLLIACVSIFSLTFFTRIYFLLKYKWVGIDSFYNFLVSQEIRKKRKLPETINKFVIPERYDYPPLIHVLLSLSKDKYHQKLQYFAPIFDMIIGSIIFCFCFFIFNSQIALIATTLYFFTPYTFDNSYSLSARSLGNSFLIVSLLSLFLYLTYGFIFTFIISIIFSTLVLLTHRLTTQSLIFVLLSISVGYYSIIPLFIILCSFLLAIVFSKGFYYRVLIGHIDFIKIFGRRLLDKNGRKKIPNKFPNPVSIVFNMPIFLMFPVFLLFYNKPPFNFFVIWGVSLTILSAIWVLGEGQRHIINAVPAFAIISSIWLVESQNYILLLLLTIISFIFLIYKIYRLEKKPNIGGITNKYMLNGFDYINSHKKNGEVMLCLPLKFTYNAAYFTGCTMLQSGGGFGMGLDFNLTLHKLVNDGKIDELIQKYNAEWVITIGGENYSIKGKKVFMNGNVKVFRISN